MAFSLASIVQTGAAVLRVAFTGSMPLSANPLGTHDARNANNWTLFGPAEGVYVGEVRVVPSDPFSFDLICTAPVIAGAWVMTASNITTTLGVELSADSMVFTAVGPQPFFAVPSDQITSEVSLRQALNAALDGPGWRAFVAALGYSDEKVAKAGKAAFYQRLLATATGEYLERLTTAYGIDKPSNVRLSDDVLRRLTIDLNNNKTNTTGLEAVLLAYYGLDATISHAQSELAEPFVLGDADDLQLHIDGQDVDIVFRDNDFAVISAAKATEVAAVINRQFWLQGLRAFAIASTDPENALTYLRIYSGLNGIKGRMKFFGGDAMRALRFPTIIGTQQTIGTQWDVTPSAITNPVPVGRVRLTWVGGTNPHLESVLSGDYVSIYGAPFAEANRGNFKIVATTPAYVEFEGNDFATLQAAVTQTGTEDVFFVKASVITLGGQYVAAVVNTDINAAEILLPVTAAAVERDETSGWYLNGETPIPLDSAYAGAGRADDSTTVTIKTVSPHNLTPGRFFFLDEITVDYAASRGSVQAVLGAPPTSGSQRCYSAVKLLDGRILACFSTAAASIHNTYFFNPNVDTWSSGTTSPFTGVGNAPALVLMSDGKVLGIGQDDFAIFDPDTNIWTSPAAHGYSNPITPPYTGVVRLKDNRILIIATDSLGAFQSSIFSPLTQTWTTPITIDAARVANTVDATAILTADGNVIAVGGGGSTAQADAAYYSVPEAKWYVIADMPFAIGYPRGVSVPAGTSGQVWVTGGQSAASNIAVLNIATMTWSSKTLNQTLPVASDAVVVERNGEAFWVPGSLSLSWERHDIHGAMSARTIAGTTGPASAVAPPTPVWAFSLDDGRILAVAQSSAVPGQTVAYMLYAREQTRSGGQLAGGLFKVTAVPAADIVQFVTPEVDAYTKITGGLMTPVRAEAGTVKSGFLLNPRDGVAITDGRAVLTATVAKGFVPTIVNVGDNSTFPDTPGYLVLGFGTSRQSQAIRYLGIIGTTQIRLDPSERLASNYIIGDTVNLLQGRGVFSPALSAGLGVTWLTNSSVGRLEAEKNIDFATAVGVNVVNRILYPGDRGLGNEGLPKAGVAKISDAVSVWGSDNYLSEAEAAREDD